jgi:hypothetical protein
MKATALCLSVLFLVLSVPLAAQAEVYIEHSRIVGATAYAEFSYEDGVVQTFVNITVDDSTALVPPQPGGPEPVRFATVSVFRMLSDTGQVLVSGAGTTDQFEFTFAPDLSTARIVADIDLPEEISGTMVAIAVDVSWNATGELEDGKSRTIVRERGYLLSSHSNGIFRDAEAAGTLYGLGDNFIPVPSIAGQIQDSKSGSLTIQIIKP